MELRYTEDNKNVLINNFRWKKDNSLFSLGDAFAQNDIRITLEKLSLKFRNVTASDAAVYACYRNGLPIHPYQVTLYSKY